MATYLHTACFSPAKSSFVKAINNNHTTTWPGLKASFVNKYLAASLLSQRGHLNQERQNLQSTKPLMIIPEVK